MGVASQGEESQHSEKDWVLRGQNDSPHPEVMATGQRAGVSPAMTLRTGPLGLGYRGEWRGTEQPGSPCRPGVEGGIHGGAGWAAPVVTEKG